jgi:hypothetical protein
MRKFNCLGLLVLALSWTGLVSAGSADLSSLPCGTQAIKLGMSPDDIKTTCGQYWEPDFVSKHERPSRKAEDGSSDYFEKWMYRTSGKNDTHVILRNGEVVRIFTIE